MFSASDWVDDFRHLTFDCDHMVAETKPAEVAALIRERMG